MKIITKLTISPKEASGLASLISGRFAFEKYIKADRAFLGALGSFFYSVISEI